MLKVKPTPHCFHGEEFSPRSGVVCDARIMANYVNCESAERTSQINFRLEENNLNADLCRPREDSRRLCYPLVPHISGLLWRSSA